MDYFKMLYADTALNGDAVGGDPLRRGASSCLFATENSLDAEEGRGLIRNTIKAIEALPIHRGTRDDIRRQCPGVAQELPGATRAKAIAGMRTQTQVNYADARPSAPYLAFPDTRQSGRRHGHNGWASNDTMRGLRANRELQFICLVPDLFWRQEPGVELSDHNPNVKKAFDLYYDFDYLAVRDMEDTWRRTTGGQRQGWRGGGLFLAVSSATSCAVAPTWTVPV